MEARPTIVNVNGTVFVHAGVTPQYAALGLDAINRIAKESLKKDRFNIGILGEQGPFWTRTIIFDAMQGNCVNLELSLSLLGATRMVVGHTIQQQSRGLLRRKAHRHRSRPVPGDFQTPWDD